MRFRVIMNKQYPPEFKHNIFLVNEDSGEITSVRVIPSGFWLGWLLRARCDLGDGTFYLPDFEWKMCKSIEDPTYTNFLNKI